MSGGDQVTSTRTPTVRTTLSVLTAGALCLPAAAPAQTASQVTPESFQPQLQNLQGSVVFSGATGTQAPPGAEQIGITLSGVSLDGGLPQRRAITDRRVGRQPGKALVGRDGDIVVALRFAA